MSTNEEEQEIIDDHHVEKVSDNQQQAIEMNATIESTQLVNSSSSSVTNYFDNRDGSHLPLSKVRKIAKLHPDVHMLNMAAVQAITIATVSHSMFYLCVLSQEKFIQLLARELYLRTQIAQRKTIQRKDIG